MSNHKLGLRYSLVPLTLILICPIIVVIFWFTLTQLDGSLTSLISFISDSGAQKVFDRVFRPILFGSSEAWSMIGVFSLFQLILMKALPAKIIKGPMTPKGNVPHYKDNGAAAFAITIAAFAIATFGFNWISPTIIYDNFGALIMALNIISIGFCALLYLKGKYFPSTSDNSLSGNFIFDFYWGTELYPRILGFDVKVFTNCRFGMMSWSLIILSFAAKQSELYGLSNGMLVAVGLQLLYITKFFWRESEYYRSLDIMHDRAGFYICWGCIVWVPSIYTLSTLFLVNHPLELSYPVAVALFAAGTLFWMLNYFADIQRQSVRESDGEAIVWGKKPEIIVAQYQTDQGETKKSILLASGFWGLSRHFRYLPEILMSLCWALPAGLTHPLPYFYVFFLTILLVHRAFRDDERCAKKYGKYWEEYCKRVPSKIIPWVY